MASEMRHDFGQSLRVSHSASDLAIWGEVYRSAFPTMVAMIDHRQDGEHQRAGIDRSVILANSKQVLIDEKYRTESYQIWNPVTEERERDILLEFVSVDTTNAPGWVCKPQRADYIAYAIGPVGECYLLPVPQLQHAWNDRGETWKEWFGVKVAKNRGYNTLNTPVPVSEVLGAITDALVLSFTRQ